jgi:hypothetical protein
VNFLPFGITSVGFHEMKFSPFRVISGELYLFIYLLFSGIIMVGSSGDEISTLRNHFGNSASTQLVVNPETRLSIAAHS